MAVQWVLYMTTRNPLLGEPPLNHTAPLGPIRPGEADVRSQVSEGMRALRDLATRKLATVNGKP